MDVDRLYTKRDLAGWQVGGGPMAEGQRGYWYSPESRVLHRGSESKATALLKDIKGRIRVAVTEILLK